MIARHRPTRGLVIGTHSGCRQLYAWDVRTGARNQLTFRAEGVEAGLISPDGRWVYYHHDHGGNEIGHHVRVPFKGGEPQVVAPGLPAYATSGMAISGTSTVLSMEVADTDGFHLYVAREQGAEGFEEARVVRSTPRPTYQPLLSHEGDIVVVHELRAADAPRFALVAVDVASGAVVGELWDGPRSNVEASTFSWLPGDTRLLGTSDASGVRRPFVWNPRTGERTDLHLPDIEGEVAPTDWSADGERVLLCRFWRAEQRVIEYELGPGVLWTVPHDGGSYGDVYEPPNVYYGPSGAIWGDWQDATHPLELRAIEPVRTILAASSVPRSTPWRSVTIPGGGGDVQAWLALPAGEDSHPAIIDMHGGPQSVAIESFSAAAQAWVDHGFAWLTVNYRGSTTFGRDFEEALWGNVGRVDVDDVVSARAWMVEQGLARADQVFLTGWSYGGFLTLQALGRFPDLWAGGMAGIAVADWVHMYEHSADTLRGYVVALFGGTPGELPERYREGSPITYAGDVLAPVLVIQGRNDSRCPAEQLLAYERRMRELGREIEVEWFDAGHGALDVELMVRHQELMLRFADRLLGLAGGSDPPARPSDS